MTVLYFCGWRLIVIDTVVADECRDSWCVEELPASVCSDRCSIKWCLILDYVEAAPWYASFGGWGSMLGRSLRKKMKILSWRNIFWILNVFSECAMEHETVSDCRVPLMNVRAPFAECYFVPWLKALWGKILKYLRKNLWPVFVPRRVTRASTYTLRVHKRRGTHRTGWADEGSIEV